MKKNRAMRAASALLVAVLMTTCTISGTFAKYVTSDSAADVARVAKWGVEIAAWDNSLFSTSYEAGNETVISSTSEKLVAPGTKNETGVNFSLTGKPEVSVAVAFDINVNADVDLAAGDYLDYTTAGNPTDTFTLADDYHPVVFTLKDGATVLKTGTLAEIEAYLEAKNATYPPNTDLNKLFGATGTGVYTLTWAWAFDVNDKADTYLGNEATLQTLDFTIGISATQVD